MWPNPVHDVLHIEATTLLLAEIYDTYGRRVVMTTGNDIDISGQPAGVYILRVVTHSGVSESRIIKK